MSTHVTLNAERTTTPCVGADERFFPGVGIGVGLQTTRAVKGLSAVCAFVPRISL